MSSIEESALASRRLSALNSLETAFETEEQPVGEVLHGVEIHRGHLFDDDSLGALPQGIHPGEILAHVSSVDGDRDVMSLSVLLERVSWRASPGNHHSLDVAAHDPNP